LTLKILDSLVVKGSSILDVGCGNGITSVAFALNGYKVIAVDPDPSTTVGTGAVKFLKEKLDLHSLEIITSFAEDVNLKEKYVDVVYCRQSMHHAFDLSSFVKNLSTFLKSGGHFITIRDHVIFDERDKQHFLDSHPLHKFYGGENGFTAIQYQDAFHAASLNIVQELKFFDSPINYFPLTSKVVEEWEREPLVVAQKLKQRLGVIGSNKFIYWLYTKIISDPKNLLDEKYYPGRMYSYIAQKK
jgi:SAM-dependent methyltransferase